MTAAKQPKYVSKAPDLRARQLANLQRNGRPPGHGLRSPQVMVPLRRRAEAWARDRWPWLDDTRLHLVADLAARVERVRVWSDEHDILLGRAGRATRAHPIVDSADRWQARLETLIERLDAEARERASGSQDPQASLDAVLAEIAAENNEVEP